MFDIRFNNYGHAHYVTFACETRDRLYTVDVYANGAVVHRINGDRVTQSAHTKTAYGCALQQEVSRMYARAMEYLEAKAGSDVEKEREIYWDIKDTLRARS